MSRGYEWLLRRAMRLLPHAFQQDFGDELRETIEARMRSAGGPVARAHVFLVEIVGLFVAAVESRFPNAWTRRTSSVTTAPVAWSDFAPDSTLAPSLTQRSSPMDNFKSDLRFALRTLARRRLVLVLAIGSLSLGIGASVAMYSIVDTVLLKPYVFRNPVQLTAVYVTWPKLHGDAAASFADRAPFSWAEFEDVKAAQTSFVDVCAYDRSSADLAGNDGVQRLRLGLASPGFFQMLGVSPAIGSLLPAAGYERQVAMLTDAFWRTRFGGETSIVGKTIDLDDRPYTVVGVLPPGVQNGTAVADVWVPRPPRPDDASQRGNHTGMQVIGRLKRGVTLDRARAEVARILVANSPPGHGLHGAAVFPLQSDRTRSLRTPMAILLAGAGLLLLVACTNVAAMLLGLGLERRREISVRGALGATHARLAQQLFTENIVLAAVGCLVGTALAYATLRGLVLLAPVGVPRLAEARIDLRAIAFAIGVALASAMIFGLIPAFSLARSTRSLSLSSARGAVAGMGRGQTVVVVCELALATMLLVAGGLLTRSLFALNDVDVGFRADQTTVVNISLPRRRFQGLSDDSASRAFEAQYRQVVDRLRAVPGVSAVTMSSSAPLLGGRGNNNVQPEGALAAADSSLTAERRFVSANYFQALGIPMRAGRGFTDEDDRQGAAPTMIISEGLARRVWPGQSAVGRRIAFWGRPAATVIGVVPDIHEVALDAEMELAFYVPFRQVQPEAGDILVRSSVPPATLDPELKAAVHDVDASIVIARIDPYRVVLSDLVASQRFRARLMVVFSVLAVLFAALGVYGVASRSVAVRTREIGVRLALGAEPRRLFVSVVGAATVLSAAGAVLGLVGAIVGGRLIERLLYGVTASDPWTLAMAATAICIVAVLAASWPGRRATRISPLEALRSE